MRWSLSLVTPLVKMWTILNPYLKEVVMIQQILELLAKVKTVVLNVTKTVVLKIKQVKEKEKEKANASRPS